MHLRSRHRLVATLAVAFARLASAQMPDMAALQRWEKVAIVHFEVVGEGQGEGPASHPADADF